MSFGGNLMKFRIYSFLTILIFTHGISFAQTQKSSTPFILESLNAKLSKCKKKEKELRAYAFYPNTKKYNEYQLKKSECKNIQSQIDTENLRNISFAKIPASSRSQGTSLFNTNQRSGVDQTAIAPGSGLPQTENNEANRSLASNDAGDNQVAGQRVLKEIKFYKGNKLIASDNNFDSGISVPPQDFNKVVSTYEEIGADGKRKVVPLTDYNSGNSLNGNWRAPNVDSQGNVIGNNSNGGTFGAGSSPGSNPTDIATQEQQAKAAIITESAKYLDEVPPLCKKEAEDKYSTKLEEIKKRSPTLDQDAQQAMAKKEVAQECKRRIAQNGGSGAFQKNADGTMTANQGPKSLNNLTDECGDTMMAMIVKEEAKNVTQTAAVSADGVNTIQMKSQSVLQKQVQERVRGNKKDIEKKYGCTVDMKYLENAQAIQTIVNAAGQMGAQITSGKAVYDTAKAAENGGNAFRAGYLNQGQAMKSIGTQQLAGSAIKAMMAVEAGHIAHKHSKAAKDVDDYYSKDVDQKGYIANDTDATNVNTTSQLLDVAAIQQGHDVSQDDMKTKHEELSAQAKMLALQTALDAVKDAWQGGEMIRQGKDMIAYSKQAFGMPAPPPQTELPQGQGIPLNLQTGQVGFGMGGGPNEAAVMDGGFNQSTPEDNAKADLPPPLLGPPTGGGLKDAPPPPGGGLVSNTGGGGGGGGLSGGGGGGGGPSGSSSENTNPSAPSLQGGVNKFDSAGGGGGYASTGGGNSNRINSTGSMNFNEMLAKFLPKQGGEEEKDPKAKGILFDGPQGARGLASEPMDASILGPNSNLFKRVSSTMLSKLKQGSLR